MKNIQGTQRVVISGVEPEVECGRFPAKRVIGEKVTVKADIFTDGHDSIRALLVHKFSKDKKWKEVYMDFLGNDRWEASFTPDKQGFYEYSVQAWIDPFLSWQKSLKAKYDAGQDVKVELQIGAQIIMDVIENAKQAPARKLTAFASNLIEYNDIREAISTAFSNELAECMLLNSPRNYYVEYDMTLKLQVDREKALFSTWYELFPRSTAQEEGAHGTFRDVEKLLPRISQMGFDVLYLPPIHPIGKSFRKGMNNSLTAEEGEPGSPWAIGGEEGGHKAIHPELGTLDDFHSLVNAANSHGLEIALDFAIQCSPDHPYVKEHPQWFKWRPDGTVQYAENPPKKYQDVLPVNFETEDWQNLWKELKSIVDYWIKQGVKIFRVDNPHTKSFNFWEWMIAEVKKKNPEVLFLAEAFTRPRVMERLAKIGFDQSYTYFTWRNTSEELQEYMTELTKSPMRDYFRPNFWPNTPDILHESLVKGGEAAHLSRLVLAATLSSNYGLYGPVYEFGINEPHPGKEEYTRNEKYELKNWDWEKETRISELMTNINKIRKENAALQTTWNIEFAEMENPELLAYLKWNDDKDNLIITVVNLDPHHSQSGWVKIPFWKAGIEIGENYKVTDLLSGDNYQWKNDLNYVELHPMKLPAHVFKVSII